MPYTPTVWTSGVTAASAANENNQEIQYTEATNSFEQDMFNLGFVYYGLVATKDGTTANQLDVTAGVSFLLQTDGTFRRRATIASTTSQFVTSTPSTSYYLDLNPDGTWSFATSHSGVTNHITICTVTTDSGGNISVVTDTRDQSPELFSQMSGRFSIPTILITGALKSDNNLMTTDGSGNIIALGNITFTGSPIITSQQSGGSATGIAFRTWSGSAAVYPLSIGADLNSAKTWIDSNGYPYITGLAGSGLINSQLSGGSATGIAFRTWSGSASIYTFSVGGQYQSALAYIDTSGNYNGGTATGIPTSRNTGSGAVATSVPIYTGTTAPTSPPTGSIWIDA